MTAMTKAAMRKAATTKAATANPATAKAAIPRPMRTTMAAAAATTGPLLAAAAPAVAGRRRPAAAALTGEVLYGDPALGPCACSQLRRTARAVSSLYDDFLAASGLTVTQYALLVNIARADGISRTTLSATLGMERTTLTRNLGPLERLGLIDDATRGADRRERVLRLTTMGRRRLQRSLPRWERAQRAFLAAFGRARFDQLRGLLAVASDAARTAAPRGTPSRASRRRA